MFAPTQYIALIAIAVMSSACFVQNIKAQKDWPTAKIMIRSDRIQDASEAKQVNPGELEGPLTVQLELQQNELSKLDRRIEAVKKSFIEIPETPMERRLAGQLGKLHSKIDELRTRVVEAESTAATGEQQKIDEFLKSHRNEKKTSIADDDAREMLYRLQLELEQRKGRYGENHPDIISLKRQIEVIEKSMNDEDGNMDSEDEGDLPTIEQFVERQLSQIRATEASIEKVREAIASQGRQYQLEELKKHKQEIVEWIEALEAFQEKTSENFQHLKLEVDGDFLRAKYKAVDHSKLEELANSKAVLEQIATKYRAVFEHESDEQVIAHLREKLTFTVDRGGDVIHLTGTLSPKPFANVVVDQWTELIKEAALEYQVGDILQAIEELNVALEETTKKLNRIEQRHLQLPESSKDDAQMQAQLLRMEHAYKTKLLQELEFGRAGGRTTQVVIIQNATMPRISEKEADQYKALREKCPELPELKKAVDR